MPGWASRRISWTVSDAVLILLLWLGTRLLAGRAGLAVPILLDRAWLLALSLGVGAGRRKADAHDLGLFWTGGLSPVLTGVVAGLGLFALLVASRWAGQVALGEVAPPLPPALLPPDGLSPAGLAGTLLLAPLAEEVYFRGLTYPVLRRLLRPAPAMLLTGLWTALGVPAWGLPAGTVLGAALALLYERGGSLLLPFVSHVVLNLLVILWGRP
ncbi:MAG: CPBP family intramembrane glutamic endopeptidase [bacterium]|nr:CPBP family intramembrane glutamic endopeptidase [bacterium]